MIIITPRHTGKGTEIIFTDNGNYYEICIKYHLLQILNYLIRKNSSPLIIHMILIFK